jgi:hypothetical protein
MALGILMAFRIPHEPLAPFHQARGGEPFIGQDEKRVVGKAPPTVPAFPTGQPNGHRDDPVLDDVP